MEWKLFADLFPWELSTKRGRGMPHTPFRNVVNTLLYVLITGCRWCDLPRGPQWASKSAAHRWLQRWQADGTLATMQARLLGLAEERGMIRWQYGAVDGAGMPLSTHTTPANGDERAQVMPLLESLQICTGKRGRPRKRLKVLAADQGDAAKDLRRRLRTRGMRPQIPTRIWKGRKLRGRPIKKEVPRDQAERTFAWFQRQYRRLVVRWDRRAACFNALLAMAMIPIWVHRLRVG